MHYLLEWLNWEGEGRLSSTRVLRTACFSSEKMWSLVLQRNAQALCHDHFNRKHPCLFVQSAEPATDAETKLKMEMIKLLNDPSRNPYGGLHLSFVCM